MCILFNFIKLFDIVFVDDDLPCTCTHVACYATDRGVDDDPPCICTHLRCYATDGGVDDDVNCTCTHVRSYATNGGVDDDFPYACTHARCYTSTLQDRTPLQFLETKTGAPLVVLHSPPARNLLLFPPVLKTRTGAPFVVLDPPRTTTVKKT